MRFRSKAISGFGRGKEIGFPTINLEIPKGLSVPFGIYAARVLISGKEYAGALHYGPIPTFDHLPVSLEIFILDFTADKKISNLEFEIVEFLREIKKFDSAAALKDQISEDVISVRRIIPRN